MKKVIGIIGKSKMKSKKNIWNKMYVSDELRYLVIKNGGVAIAVLPTEDTMEFNDDDLGDNKKLSEAEKRDLTQQINLCDGIILQGGVTSCSYEVECVKIALELDKSILGICAGFNNILRALGGKVILDKTGSHNHLDVNYRHPIRIEKDSKLFEIIQKDNIEVNSIHSMMAVPREVSKVAKISSYSEDGYVESFELSNKKFVVGIKWHPELMSEEEYVNKIFKKFIEVC